MMIKISVVIITLNEEKKIGATIDAAWKCADEIIVADSGSTDNTKSICRQKGVQVLEQNWLGYGAQRNFAVSRAANDYILVLDADEVPDDALIKAVMQQKEKGLPQKVYSLKRLSHYCGKFIYHGMEGNDVKVRLYHRAFARWSDHLVHEDLEFDEGLTPQQLDGALLHYSYDSISQHIVKTDRYTSLSASAYFAKGRGEPGILKLVLSPVFTFIQAYFLKAGFLDGWYGFILAKLHAAAVFQKYSKLKMLYQQQKESSTVENVNSGRP